MFWKIYFFVLVVLLAFYHSSVRFPRIWEVLNLVIDVIALIGLFGFCWEKKIFKRLFWKTFLPICIIWSVLYQLFIPDIQKVYVAPYLGWFELADRIFSLSINILLFIALYLYGFRRTELWE